MASLANLKGQRTRLMKQINRTTDEAKTILTSEVSETSLEEIQEEIDVNIENCRDLSRRFETLSTKIVETMQNKGDEELEAEGESSTDTLLQLSDTISRLTSRQRKISRMQQQQQSSTVQPQSMMDLTDQVQTLLRRESTQGATQSRVSGSVNLPRVEFDNFGGDVLKWSEFWDSFSASVHHNPVLEPVQKFAYLRAKLRGEAKSVIAGLETTNDNYDVALSLLRERFGNEQAAISAHYSKIMDPQSAPNQTDKLRLLTDNLEQQLRCLASLGEDVNHRHFISLILHKLPEDVVTKLEEMKGPTKQWTVEELRNKLQNHLLARESASRHCNNTSRGTDHNKWSEGRQQQNNQGGPHKRFNDRYASSRSQNGRSTTEMLYNNDRSSRGQYHDSKKFTKNRFDTNNNNSWTKPEHRDVEKRCIFCDGAHWSDECQRYRTVTERKPQVQDRCFNCFGQNHSRNMCCSTKPCYHCKSVRQHHSSLCPNKFSHRKEASHVASETTEPITTDESLLANGERAILQTAIVQAFSPLKRRQSKLRLLFDSGSHRSYISEDAAQTLQLRPKATETISVNTFAQKKSKTVQTKIVDVHLKLQDGSFKVITANVVPTISGSIQRDPINLSPYKQILKGIQIADPVPAKPEQGSIDILIGSDYHMDLLTYEKKSLGDILYLVGSKFGWILAGRSVKTTTSKGNYSMLILNHNNQSVPQLNRYNQVDKSIPLDINTEDFWNLEAIGIKEETKNDVADEKAISNFNNTVKQKNGRYFVNWPWKDDFPNLPTNFRLSAGRLKSLLRRLSMNEEMFRKYNDIIKDQLSKGVIEKVTTAPSKDSIIHYIPHQAVVKREKATTKVRIVYDASAKVNKNLPSLNECLLRGSIILENLCGLLMRFRLHKYAVVADIEKAFLQIGLQEEDRDVVRFLWLKDPSRARTDDNVQVYRFTRVPFGVVSSPFLLAATVQCHLNNARTTVAQQLKQDIYVDNIITGVSCEEELPLLYREAKELFKQASMNLREWSSNNERFIKSVSETDVCKDSAPKVLGMYWNIGNDTLSTAKVKYDVDSTTLSKRAVFRKIAQFFDPLGQFSAVIIRSKRFIQELWSDKISWDEEIPSEKRAEWIAILTDLNHLNDMTIPRCICLTKKDSVKSRLVCFCDASNTAYAIVIYLRQSSSMGDIKTTMIFSKARLAPLKRQTIPRLELLAVLIGVRAIKFTEKHLQIPIQNKSVWSDSQCVLHWIRSTKLQPSFVQNRLTEIRSHTDVTFNYVKSEDNPADIPSRGMSAKEIKSCSLWWYGPQWLRNDPINWPQENVEPENCVKHVPTTNKVLFEASLQARDEEPVMITPFQIEISKFSRLERLLRVTAWANRFLKRVKEGRPNGSKHLKAAEIKASKQSWEKAIQGNNFSNELQAISRGRKNDRVQKFDLHVDEHGIIRCGGRLLNSNLSAETKFPKLLPKDNAYTDLLIQHIHNKLFHAGVAQTLAELRCEYWLIQGRSQVRKVLSRCVICRKWEGGPFQMPKMPPLPNCRVAKTTPFSYTGVDYFGPLYTKTNGVTAKTWVCLFTCLTVRAIHLEPICEISTEQFIQALRRFVSRRGTPSQMFSDNGSNFQAAAKVTASVLNKFSENADVQGYVSSSGMSWKFIPQFSPWMGGFYERLIGLVKRHIRKAIGRISLSFIQLQTILCEVEAVVNSRPLAYVGEDYQTSYPISPAHFLSLNPKNGTSATDDYDSFSDKDDPDFFTRITSMNHLLESWKKGHSHLNGFWKAWQSDYLLSLRERTQSLLPQPRKVYSIPPAIGDIVLLKDLVLPRGSWKIGKILTVIPSADGNNRAAKVILPSGKQLTRPLSLLFPLESDHISGTPTTTTESPTIGPNPGNIQNESENTTKNYVTPSSRSQFSSSCQKKTLSSHECSTSEVMVSDSDAFALQYLTEDDAAKASCTVETKISKHNTCEQGKRERVAASNARKQLKELAEQGTL